MEALLVETGMQPSETYMYAADREKADSGIC
jgi:hypothetical protein